MENNFKGQALNFNVVVLPQVADKTVSYGDSKIDISSATDKNEKYMEGIVVSIGEMAPVDADGEKYVNEGDTVVYDKYKFSDFTQNGVTYHNLFYADLFLKK